MSDPFKLDDLQPLRDRLLVAPLAAASRTAAGLLMPETSHQRERPQSGLVLAVGPGLHHTAIVNTDPDSDTPHWQPLRVPMAVHVGDVVFYGKYSGQEFDIAGRKVLNMAEIEVFSRLPKGTFTLVEHEDPKLNHLAGDFCELCEGAAVLRP